MRGIHCDNCPNGKDKTEEQMATTSCDGIFNKINCLLHHLHERKLIYIPNGTTGIALTESVFNILRHYSTKEQDGEMEDVNIPKPADIVQNLIKEGVFVKKE